MILEEIDSKLRQLVERSGRKIVLKRAKQNPRDVDRDVLKAWSDNFPHNVFHQRWTWGKGNEGILGLDKNNEALAVLKHKGKIHVFSPVHRLKGFTDALKQIGLSVDMVEGAELEESSLNPMEMMKAVKKRIKGSKYDPRRWVLVLPDGTEVLFARVGRGPGSSSMAVYKPGKTVKDIAISSPEDAVRKLSEDVELDEGREVHLSMSDMIDQNAKHKAGGGARITSATYDRLVKKYGKGNAVTITRKQDAIDQQRIEIHKSGGNSYIITTFGDYIRVQVDKKNGGMGKSRFFTEAIGNRPKVLDFDMAERGKVQKYLISNYPLYKKMLGSHLRDLIPVPATAIKNADGDEMITFRHMSSIDTSANALKNMHRKMFGASSQDVWHRQSGNWEWVTVAFPKGTFAKMLPGVKMEGVEMSGVDKINPIRGDLLDEGIKWKEKEQPVTGLTRFVSGGVRDRVTLSPAIAPGGRMKGWRLQFGDGIYINYRIDKEDTKAAKKWAEEVMRGKREGVERDDGPTLGEGGPIRIIDESRSSISVVPAYGRDYKSVKAVEADWKAGKDFMVQDMMSDSDGMYINLADAKKDGIKTVKIRFKKGRSVAVIDIK